MTAATRDDEEFDDAERHQLEMDEAVAWSQASERQRVARTVANAQRSVMRDSVIANLRTRTLSAESELKKLKKSLAADASTTKKPKPKKKGKVPMKTKSFDALAATLGSSKVEIPEVRLTKKRKKKAKRAKAFASSLQAEPKVLAYASDAWGIEGLTDNQSAVAGQEEAESLSRVAFTLTGERSVPDMVRARDLAKAKALGGDAVKPSERRRREQEASEANEVDDAKSVENLLAWGGARSEFELKANLIRLKKQAKAIGSPS